MCELAPTLMDSPRPITVDASHHGQRTIWLGTNSSGFLLSFVDLFIFFERDNTNPIVVHMRKEMAVSFKIIYG